jgi:hypothetical protein
MMAGARNLSKPCSRNSFRSCRTDDYDDHDDYDDFNDYDEFNDYNDYDYDGYMKFEQTLFPKLFPQLSHR